ncbi:MAG: hypothetical protein DVB23_001849 [Verrucomicrobia bacterium]|nr:MAG: hypothetical protein DVB23_001849 [Verrucomicrobiota bacterium]
MNLQDDVPLPVAPLLRRRASFGWSFPGRLLATICPVMMGNPCFLQHAATLRGVEGCAGPSAADPHPNRHAK